MITSGGVVQSSNKNYVMSPYAGEIISTNLTEGLNVQKGDVLFTIKSTGLDLQAEQILGQREVYENKIKQLKRLIKAIQSKRKVVHSEKNFNKIMYCCITFLLGNK